MVLYPAFAFARGDPALADGGKNIHFIPLLGATNQSRHRFNDCRVLPLRGAPSNPLQSSPNH
jgi:hypothetical protein